MTQYDSILSNSFHLNQWSVVQYNNIYDQLFIQVHYSVNFILKMTSKWSPRQFETAFLLLALHLFSLLNGFGPFAKRLWSPAAHAGGSSDYREAVVTAMKSPLKDFCGCMTNRDTVESEATLCEDFTAAQGETKISNKFMLAGQDVVTISWKLSNYGGHKKGKVLSLEPVLGLSVLLQKQGWIMW